VGKALSRKKCKGKGNPFIIRKDGGLNPLFFFLQKINITPCPFIFFMKKPHWTNEEIELLERHFSNASKDDLKLFFSQIEVGIL
jgi:hypothetical protein